MQAWIVNGLRRKLLKHGTKKYSKTAMCFFQSLSRNSQKLRSGSALTRTPAKTLLVRFANTLFQILATGKTMIHIKEPLNDCLKTSRQKNHRPLGSKIRSFFQIKSANLFLKTLQVNQRGGR